MEKFVQQLVVEQESFDQSIPWENIAADRMNRYTEAGIALRGARFREGLSQKKLASLCGISQENLSKMENGKRGIGKAVAKKLAKILRIDDRLLTTKEKKVRDCQ